MSKKKIGLTLEEHEALGRQLKRASAEMFKAYILVATRYPHRSRATRKAQAALWALHEMRNALDDQSIRDLRERARSFIYYGAEEQPWSVPTDAQPRRDTTVRSHVDDETESSVRKETPCERG